MKHVSLGRSLIAALVVVLCLTLPALGQKRRSVGTRSPGAEFTVEKITGQVLDSVTGLPVSMVHITAGRKSDSSAADGRFEMKNVVGYGYLTIEVDRSGYQPLVKRFNPGDSPELTLRLVPTPTVTIRKTNGETLQVDTESLKFGYPVPFSGYRDSESEDFCTPDGTARYIHRSEMARMSGPAVAVAGGACCTISVMKMTLTLKSGQTTDVLFKDTCDGRYQVDVGARLHTAGTFVRVPITEITEIVFP